MQDSKRYVGSGTLRSTLSPNLINEFRMFGASGGATLFAPELAASMWKGTPVADQNGFQLNINGVCCSTTTTGTGNQANNTGHEFTDVLTDKERAALIEYLKTL